jgi:hypothetical protein
LAQTDVTIVIKATDSFSAVIDQYNSKINQAADGTNKIAASTKESGDAMSSLNDKLSVVANSIGAVVAAYVVFDQAISAGESVIQTHAAFDAMAGSMGDAKLAADQLAVSTRGLVDDEDAMATATKLMALGLVDTTQQAADFVGVGVQLGRVFGMDAASSMQTFTNILQNESPRALAQFGISSDEVKRKVNELTRSGMDAREAFRTVVLQEANDKLKQFGDNAIMAGSALDRVKIQVNDTIENILQAAAGGFEGLYNIGEQLGDLANKEKGFTDAALKSLNDYNAAARANPLTSSVVNIPNANRPNQPPSSAVLPDALADIPLVQYNPYYALRDAADRRREDSLERQGAEYGQLIARQNALNNAEINESSTIEAIRAANADRIAQEDALAEARDRAVGQTEHDYDALVRLQSQLTDSMLQGRGHFGGVTLFSDQDASNARNMAAAAEQAFQEIEDFKQQYPDMVSDADYQRMKGIYENSAQWADQAERGAQAFDSMNLSDLLGQQGGGSAGEITDLITQSLQNQGMDAESIQTIVNQMDLVTGRQTETSEYLRDTLAPQMAAIAENDGTAAAKMAEAVDAYLKNAALTGQQVTQGGIALAASPQSFGSGYDVLSGGSGTTAETPHTLQDALGTMSQSSESLALSLANAQQNLLGSVTPAQDLVSASDKTNVSYAAIAENTTTVTDNLNSMAGHSSAFSTTMGNAHSATQGIRSDIQAMTNGIKTVNIHAIVTGFDDRTGKIDAFLQAVSGPHMLAAGGDLRASQSNGMGGQHAAGGGQ